MADLVRALLRTLRAQPGLESVNVDIGTAADKATWKVRPASLQAAAQAHIDAFNPVDPAHDDAERDAYIDAQKGLQALARATYELKSTAWTLAEFRDRIKAIYRAL